MQPRVVRFRFTGLAAALVPLWFAGAMAMAAQISTDTNAIKTLSPAEARKLIAELPADGMPLEIKVADVTISCHGLSLNALTKLDAETAAVLARVDRNLALGGLTSLDAATAKVLTGGRVSAVYLHGLATLDAETARVLAASRKVPGWLTGLTTLDEATATALAGLRDQHLALDGLTEISPEVAAALARTKAPTLGLCGVTTLSVAAARALAAFGRDHEHATLHLSGLTALDPDTAAVLATMKAWSGELPRLESLDAATAKELAAFTGVGGIRGLSIGGPTAIDVATARALAAFPGMTLNLDGVTTLDAETAAALVEFKGEGLGLGGLTTLDAEIAQVLVTYPGIALNLGIPKVGPEFAGLLADFKGQSLNLTGLTTLDAATAAALAGFKGQTLSLPALTTIDADAADALADYAGQLHLQDSVKAEFYRNHPLAPESARAHAAVSGGVLPDITAFDSPDSVAIARAFAAFKRPLHLPNLRRISPKTLTALIEKEDVVIPSLEMLELIPEPDGSPTEDFIVPEGFQSGKRQQ